MCGNECRHTTNVIYAKNGPVVNVREWDTRFKIEQHTDGLLYYWEKEDEENANGKAAPGDK